MKRYMALLGWSLTAILVQVVPYGEPVLAADNSASSEIAPLGKLRVGMTANRVLMTQTPDRRVSGFGPDLGKFIAERLGGSL